MTSDQDWPALRDRLRALARWADGSWREDDPVPGEDYDPLRDLHEAEALIEQRHVLLELMRRMEPLENRADLRAAMARIIGLCDGTLS